MVDSQNSSHLKGNFNKVPLMAVLIAGAFATILNQTLLATALPHIMRDLNLDANTVQWLQSVFMLVNGIMIPITAFLIERFTTRRLFLAAMGLFGLGTFICAVSPDFLLLLAGRVLQASGAGIMMPLIQTVLFLIFPVERRGTAMGMFGLVIGFAPAIGPTLSGWLLNHFPWRNLFYIILPIVIADIILAYFILENVTEQRNPKIDILSIVLSTLGFGGLLYGFSIAGSGGWASKQLVVSMAVGAVGLIWFITRQQRLRQPILQFSVLKNKVFAITTVLSMLVFVAMIGGTVILPLFMQNMLGFTALKSGLMLLPGAIIMGAMSPITGRLFDKFGARWLAIAGLAILSVTTFMFTNFTAQTTFAYLSVINALRMLGISMVITPVTTAGLNQLPSHLIPHGTAMNNTMRQVGGAVGTALLVTVMTGNALPDQSVNGLIRGVNVSFTVVGVLAVVALALAFSIKSKQGSLNVCTSGRTPTSMTLEEKTESYLH